MKLSLLFFPIAVASSIAAVAETEKVQDPVPVTTAPSSPSPSPAPAVSSVPQPTTQAPVANGYEYEQRLYGPNAATIVAPEKANEIVQNFRSAYEKLGKPRIVFYVNRDLVDEASGLKLTGRKEKTESSVSSRKNSFEADANAAKSNGANPQTQVNVAVGGGNAGGNVDSAPGRGSSESRSTTVTGENTYSSADRAAPTLTEKLTTREIETLFGRPFRAAGAKLADQKTASSLLADLPMDQLTVSTSDAARRDREALQKIADVAIEILVSSRNVKTVAVSGDKTTSVPDIQVTAIRLSDAAVLGQASASDILGRDQAAAKLASEFGARDITEATALALMEDITQGTK
ncbi:MAG TPA: hypothetical protein VFT72_18685 [Opitutaceae bacterium]|nr:hypothetical protein [Opitutaceae bacterium]